MRSLKFLRDHTVFLSAQAMRAFKAGGVYHRQPEAVAEQAIAAGAAVAVDAASGEEALAPAPNPSAAAAARGSPARRAKRGRRS